MAAIILGSLSRHCCVCASCWRWLSGAASGNAEQRAAYRIYYDLDVLGTSQETQNGRCIIDKAEIRIFSKLLKIYEATTYKA